MKKIMAVLLTTLLSLSICYARVEGLKGVPEVMLEEVTSSYLKDGASKVMKNASTSGCRYSGQCYDIIAIFLESSSDFGNGERGGSYREVNVDLEKSCSKLNVNRGNINFEAASIAGDTCVIFNPYFTLNPRDKYKFYGYGVWRGAFTGVGGRVADENLTNICRQLGFNEYTDFEAPSTGYFKKEKLVELNYLGGIDNLIDSGHFNYDWGGYYPLETVICK